MEEKLNRRPHKLEVTGRGTGSVTGLYWIRIWVS